MKSALYIVSTGRSGTTILAQSISGNPDVVCRSIFPFENRCSQHLFVWAQNGKPANYTQLMQDAESKSTYRLYQRDDELSANWWQSRSTGIKGKRAINHVDDYYTYIALEENKPDAKIYLEKAIGYRTIARMHKWGWPLQVILLMRDPRDTYLSVKSYNKQIQKNGFGAAVFNNEELLDSYIRFYKNTKTALQNNAIPFSEVRYDALMSNPTDTLEKLAQNIEIDASDISIKNMSQAFHFKHIQTASHRTQSDQKKVSRWPYEASEQELTMFKEFDSDIEDLGFRKVA